MAENGAKAMDEATKLIREAREETQLKRAKEYKRKLKSLYDRERAAKEVLTNVQHEIEIAEAEIRKAFKE